MDRRYVLGALGTALVTSLAGCTFSLNSGAPTTAPDTQDIEVTFTNDSDRPLTFTAAALPSGLGGVRISYGDGTERTLGDVETLDDVPAEAWEGAITFAPLAEDAVRRRYDLTGGSGVGTTFDEMPRGTTVITTVTDPAQSDSMRSATAGTCGQAEHGSIRVVVDATGVVSAHSMCIDEE